MIEAPALEQAHGLAHGSTALVGLALAISAPASGVACGLAQGTLVESARDRAQAMTRWTLAGSLGDLAAPVCAALLGALGLGWRAALLVVAAALVVEALLLRRVCSARAVEDDAPAERSGRVPGRLFVWLAGTALCALLDEILAALAALRLRQDLGASRQVVGLALALWSIGAALGLLLTARLLRSVAPRRLLAASGVVCALACLSWPWAHSSGAVAVVLVVIGFASAPLYPIAKAQAYAALPGRPARVAAAAQLFTPFEIAAPWLCGLLADAAGLEIALAALALQPLLLAALALATALSPSASAVRFSIEMSEPLICPGCARRLAPRLSACPYCRTALGGGGPRRVPTGWVTAAGAGALLVVTLVLVLARRSGKEQPEEAAVDAPATASASLSAAPGVPWQEAEYRAALRGEIDLMAELVADGHDEIAELAEVDGYAGRTGVPAALVERYRSWIVSWNRRLSRVRVSSGSYRVVEGGDSLQAKQILDDQLVELYALPYAGWDIPVAQEEARCIVAGGTHDRCAGGERMKFEVLPSRAELHQRLRGVERDLVGARTLLDAKPPGGVVIPVGGSKRVGNDPGVYDVSDPTRLPSR